MRCNIAGCDNEAEEIRRPLMASNCYCRKHFFEIYDDDSPLVPEEPDEGSQ